MKSSKPKAKSSVVFIIRRFKKHLISIDVSCFPCFATNCSKQGEKVPEGIHGLGLGPGGGDYTWHDAEDVIPTPNKDKELRETLNAPLRTNTHSFAMHGIEHSFLVSNHGLDVFSDRTNNLETPAITIRFQDGGKPPSSVGSNMFQTLQKGMLIRGKSTMMLIRPANG